MGEKNRRKLTLEEHINKLPYDIKKKIYKILVKEEGNVFDVARLLKGGSKSLRYELWAEYMQRMPLWKFLFQVDFRRLGYKIQNFARELQESIGHRDDMTRWSYTHLSETDRKAIKNPLLSIIETGLDIAFIFNEQNLYEYCKRLPCSRSGFIPWGAFKLDIIHMFLDYVVHSWNIRKTIFLNDIVKRDFRNSRYLDYRSVEYDCDISLVGDVTAMITGTCLVGPVSNNVANWTNFEFYELMPAPIDYTYLWKAFTENDDGVSSRNRRYYRDKLPIYHTCRRKNKSALTLEEHINKLPYDIKKKIYKILVKEEGNVFDVARLLKGGSKSLRYELWAEYMQRMPLWKFLFQVDFRRLGYKIQNFARELQESIGHRDDMTRWSYTNLSEADRQAIGSPLLSIMETGTNTAFIFNEQNLHEYCKRLPCSRFGFIPWGAFKLDIIHMFLDCVVNSWNIRKTIFLTDIVERDYKNSRYLDYRSVEYDCDIPQVSNNNETITSSCLVGLVSNKVANWSNFEFYELMPAPIDYRYLWNALTENEHGVSSRHRRYYRNELPIYHTCRRKNKCASSLQEHINKLPYDIKKKIYKIIVKREENIIDAANLLEGGPKSLRYELWADYMQRMPLGEFMYQIEDGHSYDPDNIRNNVRELRGSIGHRDDMTRWSYTHLSEADRQAIKNPLLSIIETGLDIAFIFNEQNLYEYCKRLPCSRSGFIPWGAFKLDIIHMFLDYIVNYWRLDEVCFFTDIVERERIPPADLFYHSECDYDLPLTSNGTEIITGACLEGPRKAASVDGLNYEFYELMPAPIDYKHLWGAFKYRHYSQDLLETSPSEKRPTYRTCRREPGYFLVRALKRIKTS